MSLTNANLLVQFMAARNRFYQELHAFENTCLPENNGADIAAASCISLAELVQCHLDLSTLRPKLYVSRALNDYQVDVCIQALNRAFPTEIQNTATQSVLVWAS